MARRHLIGLLLATEEDWPAAFEAILHRLGPIRFAGETHEFATERVLNEPFDLRYRPHYALVIDRLSWWYDLPREWLKKIALMDEVYLLNNPFTFQAMEKHAAYCAMMRLGLHVPQTVLVPYKNPVEDAKYAYTAARYNRSFDLDAVAERIGYPMFMKPYDGGAWRGVSMIRNRDDLHRVYDASGAMLMHLQAAVTDYESFARALSIGAETIVMRFRPELPMHNRYEVAHGFLDPGSGMEAETISRVVNAFFRWEFNSCEMLVKSGSVYPIDYANACPDIALTSLHYYFPWAIKALLRWSVFCLVTGRRPRYDLQTREFFDIADRRDLSYPDKLAMYRRLADDYFQTEQYLDFCASRLADLDAIVLEWVSGPDFDRLLLDTVVAGYPAHEHERFVAHFRGLVGMWVTDETQRMSAAG